MEFDMSDNLLARSQRRSRVIPHDSPEAKELRGKIFI